MRKWLTTGTMTGSAITLCLLSTPTANAQRVIERLPDGRTVIYDPSPVLPGRMPIDASRRVIRDSIGDRQQTAGDQQHQTHALTTRHLLKMPVQTKDGQKIGELNDILVSSNGDMAYAVVALGNTARSDREESRDDPANNQQNQERASQRLNPPPRDNELASNKDPQGQREGDLRVIPWKMVNINTEGRDIVLRVDEEKLDDAPAFQEKNLTRKMLDQAIARTNEYFGYASRSDDRSSDTARAERNQGPANSADTAYDSTKDERFWRVSQLDKKKIALTKDGGQHSGVQDWVVGVGDRLAYAILEPQKRTGERDSQADHREANAPNQVDQADRQNGSDRRDVVAVPFQALTMDASKAEEDGAFRLDSSNDLNQAPAVDADGYTRLLDTAFASKIHRHFGTQGRDGQQGFDPRTSLYPPSDDAKPSTKERTKSSENKDASGERENADKSDATPKDADAPTPLNKRMNRNFDESLKERSKDAKDALDRGADRDLPSVDDNKATPNTLRPKTNLDRSAGSPPAGDNS
ncbi:PRC-barrel domain protein [Planctomycetes bacterium Pan216]|uniref:PRC-barrel domain protein n=1 Tax=Kolteria novifilia TaxID=2527975 RepID=A0A518B4H2_9BACT|nr:PRC-barrel domain protein [Planctomycetes bacterium Pan216]